MIGLHAGRQNSGLMVISSSSSHEENKNDGDTTQGATLRLGGIPRCETLTAQDADEQTSDVLVDMIDLAN